MLLHSGRNHTVIIAKCSPWLDVKIKLETNTTNLLYMLIHAWRKGRTETGATAASARYVSRSVLKRSIMSARQFGSPWQQCTRPIYALLIA